MMFNKLYFIIALLMSLQSWAYQWEENEKIPESGLANPLNLKAQDLKKYTRAGRFYALQYPVEITGALIPFEPIKKFLNRKITPETNSFYQESLGRLDSFDEFIQWVGLPPKPNKEGSGPYFIPFSKTKNSGHTEELPDHVGLSLIRDQNNALGMTFSCAACHSAQLFDKVVLGLQTRFPNANQLYGEGDFALSLLPTPLFKMATGATPDEAKMYRRTRKNMAFVESRKPQTLGLDTSLGHTALSLSHRRKDAYASKTIIDSQFPRYERLRNTPPDSKPGTWWNVKYKNKWLLDGSVVSGNPIFTNILWNEIGRGTDLKKLDKWLQENQKVIDELTAAIYDSEAPHITDFIDSNEFDIESAVRGQKVYRRLSCNKCHGDYIKNWELSDFNKFTKKQLLKTSQVIYHSDTPVKDVGTDPYRYEAMSSLTQLNDLEISKKNNILIKVQKGYVPPPLVGIWARWPYFHNNSIPSLCDVLTIEDKRPKSYWAGKPIDKITDFDWDCNGYPKNPPKKWKNGKGSKYLTRKKGMSNRGHSERILMKNGKLRFSESEKKDLVRFLQTL